MSARLDPTMKPGPACAKCGTERHHTGTRWRCSKCYNEWQTKDRAKRSPERRKKEMATQTATRRLKSDEWRAEQNAAVEKWRQANREAYLRGSRDHYARNAEAIRAKKLAEYYANPEPFLARNFLRKARMLEQVCGHGDDCVDATFLATIYAADCTYCGAQAEHADHYYPLARGGLHCRENIVPACDPCNRSKHARDPIEWLESRTA